MEIKDLELIFKALSDKQRLRILSLLLEGPIVVNDIKNVLHVSMSTVSQHLTILRYAGFVEDDKQGRWVYYGLSRQVQDEQNLRYKLFGELKSIFENEDDFVFDRKLLHQQQNPPFGITTEDEDE